jgi:predicted PurR-regulated permease PerM
MPPRQAPRAPAAASAGVLEEPAQPAIPHTPRPVITVRTLVVSALIVLAIVALVILLSQVLGIVLVVLVAIVFAEGIRPLAHRLVAVGVPLPLAIVMVYVALLAFLVLLIALLVQPIISEAQSLANNFPTYQHQVTGFVNGLQSQFHINVDIGSKIDSALGAAQQVLFAIGSTIFGIVVDFILVLVIGFLWLVSSDRLKAFVVDLMPPRHQVVARDVFREIGFRMGGYLRAVALNSVAVGAATGIACALLNLPSPILLGIFAGLTAAVPLVGPFIGVVPPVLLGFSVSPAYPVLVLVVLLAIQLIDANTVVPLVMNRVVALPALAVVLALLIGGALQGLIGALLAVPIAAAVQVVLLRVVVPMVHASQGRELVIQPAFDPVRKPARAALLARRLNPRLRRR